MARTVTGRTLGEIQCAMHKMDAEGAKEWCFLLLFKRSGKRTGAKDSFRIETLHSVFSLLSQKLFASL